MIIVDGNTRNEGIGTFANLEEVLNHIMQDESMENRIVTDVLVNNEIFSEVYPHQAEDITVDGISSVEVRSVPVSEMAVNMAGEMGKVARMMAHGARHVARLFRAAEDTEALELLQDLLDVTRDFMGMVSELRNNFTGGGLTDFMEKSEKFSDLLSEMADVLENEDWILLADLLQYEFLDQCEAWQAVSEQLHRQVVEHLAQ